MNRRAFIERSTLATLGATLAGRDLLAQAVPPAPAAARPPGPVVATPPVLQDMTERSVRVFWSTPAPASGWIEYGSTPALGLVARGEQAGLLPYDSRVLAVRLSGLKPGTKYYYRTQTVPVDFKGPYNIVRGEPVAGPVFEFTTFDAAAARTSFLIWNDTHQNNITLTRLARHVPDYPADFLLWNGDIFNDVRTEDMLIAETLHPARLEYAATRPLVFARGNHDVRGAQARMLGRTLAAPDGRYYYSFRQGPVAFLVLDTGEDKDDGHPEYGGLGDFASYRLEQQAWLEQELRRPEFRAAPFRVLITHIPLRGFAESVDSWRKWGALLQTARFDYAFSGHTHRHAYNAPTAEQPWPLLVGGGPAPEGATFIHVAADARELRVRMFDLQAAALGEWTVSRRDA